MPVTSLIGPQTSSGCLLGPVAFGGGGGGSGAGAFHRRPADPFGTGAFLVGILFVLLLLRSDAAALSLGGVGGGAFSGT